MKGDLSLEVLETIEESLYDSIVKAELMLNAWKGRSRVSYFETHLSELTKAVNEVSELIKSKEKIGEKE